MSILNKKLFRDLFRMKGQFFAIFILVIAAISIFTALDGVWYSMEQSTHHFFEESNLANRWFVTKNTQDRCHDIEKIDGVKQVESELFLQVDQKSETQNKKLMLSVIERNNISSFKVVDGKPFDQEENGIWIDYEYARQNNIKVDENTTIQVLDKDISLKVIGIINSPEYISYTGTENRLIPNHREYGYAYMNKKSFTDNLATAGINRYKVVYQEGSDADKVNREIRRVLGDDYLSSYDRNENGNIASVENKKEQLFKMSVVFSTVLIILVILTVSTMMKRLVEQQRIQIGTFKALGVKKHQLLVHYGIYAFITTLISGVVGLLLGYYLLTQPLLEIQKIFYTFDTLETKHTIFPYVILVTLVLLSTFAAMFSCRKIIKQSITQTMRGELLTQKQPLLEKIPFIWNLFRFETKWYLRNTAQNMYRLIATVLGIAGSFTLLIASFGLHDSLVGTNEYLFYEQSNYQLELKLTPNIARNQLSKIEEEIGNNDFQYVSKQLAEVEYKSNVKNTTMMIYSDANLVTFKTIDGHTANIKDGVYITKGFAEKNNIKKDSEVKIRLFSGQYLYVPIKDVITSPSPQGIYMSEQTWKNLGEVFSPTSMYVANTDKITTLKTISGVSEVVEKNTQFDESVKVFNSILPIIVMMILASLLLNIIVQYNFGLLNFTERYREYATMRVLGFQKKDIKKLIIQDIRFNTILGFFVGVPMSILMLHFYIQIVATPQMNYLVYLSIPSMLIILFIFVMSSIFFGVLLYRRVKKINMVESLKANE